jgi:hypothetical protein
VYFILENLILIAKKCATRRNLQFQGSYRCLAESQTSKLNCDLWSAVWRLPGSYGKSANQWAHVSFFHRSSSLLCSHEQLATGPKARFRVRCMESARTLRKDARIIWGHCQMQTHYEERVTFWTVEPRLRLPDLRWRGGYLRCAERKLVLAGFENTHWK